MALRHWGPDKWDFRFIRFRGLLLPLGYLPCEFDWIGLIRGEFDIDFTVKERDRSIGNEGVVKQIVGLLDLFLDWAHRGLRYNLLNLLVEVLDTERSNGREGWLKCKGMRTDTGCRPFGLVEHIFIGTEHE